MRKLWGMCLTLFFPLDFHREIVCLLDSVVCSPIAQHRSRGQGGGGGGEWGVGREIRF